MGLSTYRKKRNFRETAEPIGGKKKRHKSPFSTFAIQKHAATRLHYDFRLEIEGVLKSWAVPKGPSLDPSIKRLAMQVEDHPIEYGSFEGTIPKREYGGGSVLLWDTGTWEIQGDALKDYRKGILKFTLNGEKLRGRWMLIKFKGGDGAKATWLLRKEADEFASTKDILKDRPESVKSGLLLEEIGNRTSKKRTLKKSRHTRGA